MPKDKAKGRRGLGEVAPEVKDEPPKRRGLSAVARDMKKRLQPGSEGPPKKMLGGFVPRGDVASDTNAPSGGTAVIHPPSKAKDG